MSAPAPTCPDGAQLINVGTLSFCMLNGQGVGPPTCPAGFVYTPGNLYRCEVDPATTAATQQQAVADATASAQAAVDRYTLSFTALQGQKEQLQKTLDLMTSAKGLYSGVSDDLHYSVDEFTKNIADLQNQINITNRKIASPSWYPWLDMFLNVMLVLVLLYAIYVVVSKIYVRPVVPQFQYPY
uniref:Uncharacterized protein n=1 Tax=viral metagenome TaxID=1070528 RepID=A0A6C0JJ59_9ZZZZ